MAKSKGINLLPQEEFDASLMGRLLRWATGTFRIIVIVTEIIVMGAFLSRFWLDAQNSDLTESIDIKSAQIESQSDFENDFRLAQKKLSIVKILAAEDPSSGKFAEIVTKMPQEIRLTGISVNDNSAQIKGTSPSEFGIAQFISNLQAEENFKDVSLSSIDTTNDNSNLITFTVNLNY